MMQIKGLIFDLDGVIVHTAQFHYLAWKEIADELGVAFDEKENENLKGVSRIKSFQHILQIGGLHMTDPQIEAYCTKKNQIYLSYIEKLSQDHILPGVKDFIADARKKGCKTALGSSSKNSRLILDELKLQDLFDAIIDGTVVTKAKPNPEVFLKGADSLNIPVGQCLVFEDANAGIEAAHRAGMKAIGVGEKSQLPGADMHITGFDNIKLTEIAAALWMAI